MTSKEALEELYNNLGCEECKNDKCKYKQSTINDCDVWRNTIKQDLDRLEQLEDNIKIHKETIKMQHNQIESLQSNLKCSQENEEAVLTTLNSATDEITELKKIIEILKDKNVYITKLIQSTSLEDYNELVNGWYELGSDELKQKEYDLLKEWFGND